MKATRPLPTSLLINSIPITKKLSKFSSLNSTYHHRPKISTGSTMVQTLNIAATLNFSSRTKNHFLGSKIHAQIVKLGFSNDIFTNNNLVWMYSKCGILGHALNLFDEMPDRNLVSWTCMISGCIHNIEHEMGLTLFVEMLGSGFHPNEFTLASGLSACAALEAIKRGRSLHAVAFKIGCERNTFVGSSLLCMYAKCENIEAAEMVFGCIDNKDLACWNAMAECYALSGYDYDAMKIVCLMHLKGYLADEFTFICALKTTAISGILNFGRQIHSFIIYHELESSTSVMNSLMDMYFRNEMIDCAMEAFSRIREKDIVSWNTVICGFAQDEDLKEVVTLFSSMLYSGQKPNQITFSAIFRLCGVWENPSLGLEFCCFAYHLGFFNNALVVNALINMFSKCGLMNKAYSLFSFHGNKSTFTYNEIIAGYNLNGLVTQPLILFGSLFSSDLKSDEFTYTTVLSACQRAKQQQICEQIHANIIKSGFSSDSYICSSLITAYEQFGLVENFYKIFKDVKVLDMVCWGAMISAFARQDFIHEAFSLLNSLREIGASPDDSIFGSILNACASNGMLNQCKCIHSLVMKTGYDTHLHVASAAIDAYAKCGDISSSSLAFDCALGDNDDVLFNTMITAFAHHGMVVEAFQILERMKQANRPPTQSTFIAVISACSHLGLVEEGQHLFDSISSIYGMIPSKDNFGCLVDLHARNGQLEKAKGVIESMPYEPWPAVLRSFLSGCRIHGDKKMAKLASENLQLQQGNDGALVLLSNAYAEDGKWGDAANLRMIMVQEGIQKVPGCSIVGL